MRLFIAINFPGEWLQVFHNSFAPLRTAFPNISWIPVENVHLTLKFLGQVKTTEGEKAFNDIRETLKRTASPVNPFTIHFDSLGYFPKDPVVVYEGLRPNEQLNHLVRLLDESFYSLGFPKDRRLFKPHITLGRGKRFTSLEYSLLRQRLAIFPWKSSHPVQVSHIQLVESILSSLGPRYLLKQSFPLAGIE